jgi:hypothetical protein
VIIIFLRKKFMKLVFAFISLILSSSLCASASNDSKPEFEEIRRVQLNPSTWFADYKNHKTGERVRYISNAAGSYWEDHDGGTFLGGTSIMNEFVYSMDIGFVDLQRKEYGELQRKRVEKEKESLQEENHEMCEGESEEKCECEHEKQKSRFSFEPTSL